MKKNIYPKIVYLQKLESQQTFVEYCGCWSVVISAYTDKGLSNLKRKLNPCRNHHWAYSVDFEILEDEKVIIF